MWPWLQTNLIDNDSGNGRRGKIFGKYSIKCTWFIRLSRDKCVTRTLQAEQLIVINFLVDDAQFLLQS